MTETNSVSLDREVRMVSIQGMDELISLFGTC